MAPSPNTAQIDQFKAGTIPGLLWERAKRTPQQVAFRAKRRGVYQECTWQELRKLAAECALALKELGFTRGDRLAFMGDACQEYVICELAAQALGGLTLGIYPSTCPGDLAHILDNARPSFVAVSGPVERERLAPLLTQTGPAPGVIMLGGQAAQGSLDFRRLLSRGRELLAERAGAMDRKVEQLTPDDGLFIAYTAGTGGRPKGVLVSHGQHLAATATLLDRYPLLNAKPHRTVAFLPQGIILGRQTAVTLPLMTGLVPHFGDVMEGLAAAMFETAPSVLLFTPPYLHRMATSLRVAINESSPLKRGVYRLARRLAGNRPKGPGGFLARCLATGPILNKLGFSRLDLVLCSGAPLAPGLQAFWQAHGLNLCEYYSQTEAGGAALIAQPGHFPAPGQGGRPPEGWDIRLGPDREIQMRGPGVASGYWHGPDSVTPMMDSREWLATGDPGEEGQTGLYQVSGPFTRAEQALASSPYVNQAVVLPSGGAGPAALVELDLEAVASWARGRELAYTGAAELTTHTRVRELIQAELQAAMDGVPANEHPAAMAVIPGMLDPIRDEDPLTPTRVMRRRAALERFGEMLQEV